MRAGIQIEGFAAEVLQGLMGEESLIAQAMRGAGVLKSFGSPSGRLVDLGQQLSLLEALRVFKNSFHPTRMVSVIMRYS